MQYGLHAKGSPKQQKVQPRAAGQRQGQLGQRHPPRIRRQNQQGLPDILLPFTAEKVPAQQGHKRRQRENAAQRLHAGQNPVGFSQVRNPAAVQPALHKYQQHNKQRPKYEHRQHAAAPQLGAFGPQVNAKTRHYSTSPKLFHAATTAAAPQTPKQTSAGKRENETGNRTPGTPCTPQSAAQAMVKIGTRFVSIDYTSALNRYPTPYTVRIKAGRSGLGSTFLRSLLIKAMMLPSS